MRRVCVVAVLVIAVPARAAHAQSGDGGRAVSAARHEPSQSRVGSIIGEVLAGEGLGALAFGAGALFGLGLDPDGYAGVLVAGAIGATLGVSTGVALADDEGDYAWALLGGALGSLMSVLVTIPLVETDGAPVAVLAWLVLPVSGSVIAYEWSISG